MKRRLLAAVAFALLGGVATFLVALATGAWAPLEYRPPSRSEDRTAQQLLALHGVQARGPNLWTCGWLGIGYESVLVMTAVEMGSGGRGLYRELGLCKTGWPLHCLQGRVVRKQRSEGAWMSRGAPGRGRWHGRLVPYQPTWFGFAANTAFYAALLWLLIPGPFALRRFLRLRRGLCPKCAYPMGESAVCTECGDPLPRRRQMPNPT